MSNSTPKLEWCRVRFGEDMNWWIYEISDYVHWDVDGLSIIDPRQLQHIIELMEPLADYGFKPEIFENAFFTFTITKDLKEGKLELRRNYDSILDSDEPQFALPDILDDEKGAYADFITHVTRLRVKLLNDLIDFQQPFTIEELEEDVRESQNQDYMEGRATHFFTEVTAILEFVPEGFELDKDTDEDTGGAGGEETDETADIDDAFEDIEETPDSEIERDETMRWDDDEEDDDDSDGAEKSQDSDEDDDLM